MPKAVEDEDRLDMVDVKDRYVITITKKLRVKMEIEVGDSLDAFVRGDELVFRKTKSKPKTSGSS